MPLAWETNVDAARQRAASERRFILADFGKDH